MGYTAEILDDVRRQIAPDDSVLKEARERRENIKAIASSYDGVARSYSSGSLAHGTANCPIHLRDKGLDADCGVVLDRRVHPTLGPDSIVNEGPCRLSGEFVEYLRPRLLNMYPHARLELTKRAVFIEIKEPMPDGEDPTIDLVIGLQRREKGLWIPNTEADRWDPSHPEMHTALLTAEPKQLRVTRARAIRLSKAENKRTSQPPLCSFNIEAFGLMFVAADMDVTHALLMLWTQGAADLQRRLTPDPAHVSRPIKVQDRTYAVQRLQHAAQRLQAALANDDNEAVVRQHLHALWPDYVAASRHESTKARIAAALKSKRALGVSTGGGLTTGIGEPLKSTRSFGDGRSSS